MKNFLKTLLIVTLCTAMFQACGSDGDDDSPAEISLSSIVGYWGISSSTEDGSTQSRVPCENTVDIQSNGDFLLILNHEGEVIEGNMSVNPADSTLTLSVNGQTETLKLVAVTDNGFQLESTDGSGASVTVNLDQFVRLNDGDCDTITEANLIGQWQISEVENFDPNAGQDDGPQVGMILDFVNDGTGDITVNGDAILTFTYSFINSSNIRMVFDDDDGGDSDSSSIFHISSNNTSSLELLVFDSESEHSDDNGLAFRVVMDRQN